MRFKDYFDAIYFINLDRRVDRVDRFKERISEATEDTFDIDNATIKRFSAVDGYKLDPATYSNSNGAGAEGCKRSHLYIFQECLRNKNSSVLILEDDVVFDNNFSEQFIDFISKVPEDWDMLYLGGNHQRPPIEVNAPVHRVQVFSTHAYAVKASLFPRVIKLLEDATIPLDVAYRDVLHTDPEVNTYGCQPQIAWQEVGFSDIENHDVDHRPVLGGKF